MKMRLESILEKGQRLLFLIFPAVLILKPRAAVNAVGIVLLLLSFGHVYLNKKLIITFYEKFLLLLLGTLVISMVFTPYDTTLGTTLFKRYLRYLFYPTMLGQLELKKEDIRNILISITIGLLGYFGRFVQEVVSLKAADVSWMEFFKSSRPWNARYLENYDIPQTSLLLGTMSIVIYYAINVIKEKKYKLALLVMLAMTGIPFLGLQSRGMMLTLIVLLFFLAIVRKEKVFKIVPGVFIVAILCIGIHFSNSRYIERYETVVSGRSFHSRREVHREAMRLFKERPITGVGFHNFSMLQNGENYEVFPEYEDPHNQAIKMLCETGIVGFVAYYLFMGSILIALWKKARTNKYDMIGVLTILSLLLYENIECMFKSVHSLPYIFFIIGIFLHSYYQEKNI